MDWELLLLFLIFALFFWWLGFIATRRMRLEKQRLRDEARRALIEQSKRDATLILPPAKE